MKWVKLKNLKKLYQAGFTVVHVSDDGEFIRFKKGNGPELGLWSDLDARAVVNYGTIHENAVKMYPDAFEKTKAPLHYKSDFSFPDHLSFAVGCTSAFMIDGFIYKEPAAWLMVCINIGLVTYAAWVAVQKDRGEK